MLRSSMLAALSLLSTLALAEPPQTHHDLDWTGPWRWVHIDNVDAGRYGDFESARLGWKKALRQDDILLGDGRPLLWCARGDDVRTYFTFYPFRTWADLDARAEMAKHTNEVVGEEAVKTYDTGDATLLPPHGSQIWRRQDSADIAWAGTSTLSERTAAVGRLERREVDWIRWDEFEAAWTEVQAALVAQQYPLACRVYANSYGGVQGDWVLLWLAPDEAAFHAAPEVTNALVNQLGADKGAQLAADLARLFPVKSSFDVERRLDLSNLGE